MPAPNAFSPNRKLSVFSPENKVVVFHGKHHNFLAKPDLFFLISPHFSSRPTASGGAKLFCLD